MSLDLVGYYGSQWTMGAAHPFRLYGRQRQSGGAAGGTLGTGRATRGQALALIAVRAVPRAVATCGTALTVDHLRTLQKFARRIVLAFDADAAGQDDAARFYQWERDLDLDIAVAALPVGVDPGDLAQSDPQALQTSVAAAVPFLGFRVGRALDAAVLASPEGRARAAETALGVIAEHPSCSQAI